MAAIFVGVGVGFGAFSGGPGGFKPAFLLGGIASVVAGFALMNEANRRDALAVGRG